MRSRAWPRRLSPHHEIGEEARESDATHFIVRDSFGDAADAGGFKRNTHFFVLREFCEVASKDNCFAFVLP